LLEYRPMPIAKSLSKTEVRTDDAPRTIPASREEVSPSVAPAPVAEALDAEYDPYDNVACTD